MQMIMASTGVRKVEEEPGTTLLRWKNICGHIVFNLTSILLIKAFNITDWKKRCFCRNVFPTRHSENNFYKSVQALQSFL